MNAAAEIKQRAPYRTKKWWAKFDDEMSQKFPIGETAKVRRGPRGFVNVKILTRCSHGKIEVLNLVTGSQYRANVENMIPPSTRNVLQMNAELAPERVRQAEEQSARRSRPTVLRQFLQPLQTADRRDPEYRQRARNLALSTDELTAYTSLSAINKTLSTLHLNRDCFRNPKLFDLIKAAHTCLATCMQEMESYNELPADA